MRKRMRIPFTTAADGSASATGSQALTAARLMAVVWNKGTCANGVDVTIATTGADASGTLLAVTNADASAVYRPMAATVDASGNAIAGEYVEPLMDGIPTVTIAQGGDTKSGSVVLILDIGE